MKRFKDQKKCFITVSKIKISVSLRFIYLVNPISATVDVIYPAKFQNCEICLNWIVTPFFTYFAFKPLVLNLGIWLIAIHEMTNHTNVIRFVALLCFSSLGGLVGFFLWFIFLQQFFCVSSHIVFCDNCFLRFIKPFLWFFCTLLFVK